MTWTLTSDDLESHMVVNVSSTLTNSTICLWLHWVWLWTYVRTDGRTDGRTYVRTDGRTDGHFYRRRWPKKCRNLDDLGVMGHPRSPAMLPFDRVHTTSYLTLIEIGMWRSLHSRFTGARDSEWQWHQLDHMQICILTQTDMITMLWAFVSVIILNVHFVSTLSGSVSFINLGKILHILLMYIFQNILKLYV